MIIITSCEELDLDSLISSQAYTHFLSQKGEKTTHMQHVALSDFQKEVFDMCKLKSPELFDLKKNLDDAKFIIVNPYSIETLHPSISPRNIEGVMGKKKPQYIDEFNFKRTHLEEVECFSTLIAEKFMHTKTPIDPHIASLLIIGIVLTLNGLEENITTNRDFVALEYLQKHSHLSRDQIIPLINKL